MKKQGKNFVFANLTLIIGVILVTISVAYFTYTKVRIGNRNENIERAKQQFVNDMKDKEKNSSIYEEEKVRDDETSISNSLGYIEIEKLNLILPIFPGTSQEELRYGTGIVEGTDIPNSSKSTVSVIAGHRGGYNGDKTFLNIDKLKSGDEIKVTTSKEELIYRVAKQEIIESTDWSKFTREEDKSKLILMSCHPYPRNYQRILVISELDRVNNLGDS